MIVTIFLTKSVILATSQEKCQILANPGRNKCQILRPLCTHSIHIYAMMRVCCTGNHDLLSRHCCVVEIGDASTGAASQWKRRSSPISWQSRQLWQLWQLWWTKACMAESQCAIHQISSPWTIALCHFYHTYLGEVFKNPSNGKIPLRGYPPP